MKGNQNGYLRLDEVVDAFAKLGGEEEWLDVRSVVAKARRGSHRPYQSRETFEKAMFQVVQVRCEGYAKFTGVVCFEKVRRGRFRLISPVKVAKRSSAVKKKDHSVDPPDQAALLSAALFEAAGEGEDHRRLKEFIARSPQVVGLPRGTPHGLVEYPLPSGDRVDVLFKSGGSWLAVEVKGRRSPEADVVRGLFQCIKYRAVLEAYQQSLLMPSDAGAVLVLETDLPRQLLSLRDILQVQVLDKISPNKQTATA